mmetsp:Transcript_10815/g.24433  ORF Transcript_10815/g.24433 Transcript_10815/m.24433 type:complete len:180 (-) Transcript_10815:91-630(-)
MAAGADTQGAEVAAFQRCFLGELLAALATAVVVGGFVGFALGPQSVAQFAAQAVAAGSGSYWYATSRPSECPLLAASSSAGPPGLTGGPSRLLPRLGGASAGAFLAWLAFPPDLDFALVASSIIMAAGSAVASIASEISNPKPAVEPSEADKADAAPPEVVGMVSHLDEQESVEMAEQA